MNQIGVSMNIVTCIRNEYKQARHNLTRGRGYLVRRYMVGISILYTLVAIWLVQRGEALTLGSLDGRTMGITLMASLVYGSWTLPDVLKLVSAFQNGKGIASCISRLYSLYPSDIRDEYGEEMSLVMQYDWQEARIRGRFSQLHRILFSFMQLLLDLVRVYWSRWHPLKYFSLP